MATKSPKTSGKALATLATTKAIADQRSTFPVGASQRGSVRFATANAPTWATEIPAERPSVTP